VEVILIENIEGLGRKGDRVQVREGYGRNHLLPYRKAIPATADALSRLEAMKKKFAVEEAKIVADLKGVAGKLEGVTVEFTMRATPEGHLFGSVSPKVLAAALKERGHEVSDREIRMKEPIKDVGTHTASIHLHADVQVAVTVVVKPEEAPQAEAEGEAPAAEASGAPAGSPANEGTPPPAAASAG
jgi:large subunit ribosomal protein L9